MKLYRVFILFLIVGVSQQLYAQKDTKLEVPMMIEQTAGEPIIFKVHWDSSFEINWTSDISTVEFDEQEGEFYLSNTADHIGLHQINISLTDSLKRNIASERVLIKIYAAAKIPKITFKQYDLVNDGFIELKQGETYELEFEAFAQGAHPNEVLLSYLIDNDPGNINLENSEVTIVDNRLIFNWTPTQKQADRKYHELEIIAIDAQNKVSRKEFHFKVVDQDIPPQFKYSIQPQYSISPNKQFTIDFSVTDPDGDEYFYSSSLEKEIGAYYTTESGKFNWMINSTEFNSLQKEFPVTLSLFVIEKNSLDTLLSKKVSIIETRDNAAPEITRLSNINVKEGYPIKRRVFYTDENHSVDQLKFSLENAPSWLYLEQIDEALYLISDTLGFNIVKADGIAVQYDVLLTVKDPQNASDNQFFTVTVNEGINAEDIYKKYINYSESTNNILIGIRDRIEELDNRLKRNKKLKRGFLYTTILLGGYSGIASFFDENTIAKQAVPYTGAVLAITSSINALAFNQDGDITTIKVKLEQIEKELIRNRSFLQLYDIQSVQDEQLRNPEFSDKLKQYRQQLIAQRIELEKLEQEYRQLNYVMRHIRKSERKGLEDEADWQFLHE